MVSGDGDGDGDNGRWDAFVDVESRKRRKVASQNEPTQVQVARLRRRWNGAVSFVLVGAAPTCGCDRMP